MAGIALAAADTPVPQTEAERSRAGFSSGVTAYLLWGFLPLLFHFLEPAGPLTVVADRTLCSLVFVGVILWAGRRLPEIRAALSDMRTLRSMLISSVLLAVNWSLYVWAVQAGQVLEGSFGYFINPLVNILIGMVLLGERNNRWQNAAIILAFFAIIIQAIGIGRIPYIALGLGLSFGFYGYFRKTANVGSSTGLFLETLLLAPLALGYLVYTFVRDGGPGVHADPVMLGMLLLTGPATAVPLLLFAFAVQRLRLTTAGMLQYIAPSIQFFLALYVFSEPLNSVRLLSFVLIWVSLAIYSLDSLLRRRADRPQAA